MRDPCVILFGPIQMIGEFELLRWHFVMISSPLFILLYWSKFVLLMFILLLFDPNGLGVAGGFHHEVRGIRLGKTLQNNSPILIIFTSLLGRISLLWRGISGSTIGRW